MKKGEKRPPNVGRKKGTPNKVTADLYAIAARQDIQPFEVLVMVAANDWKGLGYDSDVFHAERPDGDGGSSIIEKPVITLDQRIMAAKEASKYLYPQRKAVEVSSPDGEGFKVVLMDYTSKEKK